LVASQALKKPTDFGPVSKVGERLGLKIGGFGLDRLGKEILKRANKSTVGGLGHLSASTPE